MDKTTEPEARSLLLLSGGQGRFCLWPVGVTPPEGWTEALATGERSRFIGELIAKLPALQPVTFVKAGESA
ncbi:hypothetical protein [Streptomyces sp. NPDC058548]|uniref:hypothetical protein n=1 Tax=unclassified Streptomyces TaxID=2593676 RepID=UPI00364EFB3B